MDNNSGAATTGIVYSNISTASTNYSIDKLLASGGTGFAAEQANHLYDKIGSDPVRLVSEEIDPATGHIVKNGADRIVDGINIQTKYYATGSQCVSACFENGEFRYYNCDGTPMQIEVPSDQYQSALKAMERRIEDGQVPGVTNPNDATDIIRCGHFTYEQAKNIAQAGTIESIQFDMANGAIIATNALGLSATLSFAISIWGGDDLQTALKKATYTGMRVGTTAFATALLAGQLAKTGLNSALASGSDAIIHAMGPEASATLVNAFRSGTNIYGAAAMNSASKLLRGNAITGAISVAVLSTGDIINIFRGRISRGQLVKNVVNTSSSVAGGSAGWVSGATIGAGVGSAIPLIGTAAGTMVGGLVGALATGTLTGKISDTIMSAFIKNDSEEMLSILENSFEKFAKDYLLNQQEAENVVNCLKSDLTPHSLKNMYASSNRKAFANNMLLGYVKKEAALRKKISPKMELYPEGN